MELAYGAIRWRARLHHDLDALLPKGLASLPHDVAAILELGAYQLLFMDRVPAWSAVDESVALVRAETPLAVASWAAGLVNAVLRNLDRQRGELPPPEGDLAARLSVLQSHPRWLVERWLDRFGLEATERLLERDNQPPFLHLHVNELRATPQAALDRLTAAGHDVRLHDLAPNAIVVASRAAPEELPGWDEGWFWAQDAGAQWVIASTSPPAGAAVLDACSAPGAKLAALLAREGAGPALAVDREPARLGLVQANLARLGLGARLAVADARALPTRERFDFVLADVPCTGTGVLRRRVDARWRRRPEDVARFAAFQRELLAAVAEHVRPGGTLLYATCSLEREENEGVVEPFLAEAPAFRLAPVEEVPPDLRSGPYLFTRPWLGDMDGMFAARLVRVAG
jgi:16S rRNA (cytosine967-C5)-methyltransferase